MTVNDSVCLSIHDVVLCTKEPLYLHTAITVVGLIIKQNSTAHYICIILKVMVYTLSKTTGLVAQGLQVLLFLPS